MTRDELEAIIRQQVTRCVTYALEGYVPTEAMNRAAVAILQAADAYGLAEFGIQAERRPALLAGTVSDGSYGGRAS